MRTILSLSTLRGSWNSPKLLKKSYSLSRIRVKMPPRKKSSDDDKPTPLMGRIGTTLKCGIVGLPNVGWVFIYARFLASK